MCPMSYLPTDSDRCNVAAAYDNENRASFDPVLSAGDYIANGATVTLKDDGETYWVVTIAEAREVGISFDTVDVIIVNGRKWVVTLA